MGVRVVRVQPGCPGYVAGAADDALPEAAMKMVLESPFSDLPIPSMYEGRGALRMDPKLRLRLADPVHKDDPIPFPGREALSASRWRPRLAKESSDPVVRGVERVLEEMDAKLRDLGRMIEDSDQDDDRPRAA